jgi:DNA-binding transcriptional ArsR family regulator
MSQKTTSTEAAIDHRLLKALSHPLRQRILRVLNERVASPSELSRDLDEPLGNVSYHVKALLEHDAIELVRTAPVRGALEHFYRAMTRVQLDDDHWARLPLSIRRSLSDQMLQQIWDHLAAAAEENGFDDPRMHVSWTPLELDAEGHDAISDLLAETLERILEIQAESTSRIAALDGDGDGEPKHRTEVAMVHFHRAANSPSKQESNRRKAAKAKRS